MKLSKKHFWVIGFCLQMFAIAGLAQSSNDSIECNQPYVVAPGDTLRQITQRAYGSDQLNAFYEVNRATIGGNPDLIEVGILLDIPCDLDLSPASGIREADFSPAPEATKTTDVETPAGTEALLIFNRAAAPNFILNVGIIDDYLAQITEITEGRVRFIDPPETDRDPRAQLDLVISGEADGAYIFNGHLADSHPLLQLPMQPLMGGTAEQTAVTLWRLHEEYLSRTNYLSGIRLLGFIGAPAAHIWRLKEATVTLGENISNSNEYTVPYFDGLDTRGALAIQEENAAWLAEFDEQQGKTMTMVMAHGAALAGGIWKENNRTVTEIRNGVYTPTFSVFLSDEAWMKISPADQTAIASISGEVLSQKSAAWDSFDNGLRSKMLDQGLDAVEADMALLAELQDQSRIGLERWIAAADASGISGYDAINDYMEDLRSSER